MTGTGPARAFLASALILNLISYAAWGSTILPRTDISDYIRNHSVREIVVGGVLTLTLLAALRRPVSKALAAPLIALSGGSVLGFWIGLVALGGIDTIDTVFAGQKPLIAYALHVPQLLLWLIGSLLLAARLRVLRDST